MAMKVKRHHMLSGKPTEEDLRSTAFKNIGISATVGCPEL